MSIFQLFVSELVWHEELEFRPYILVMLSLLGLERAFQLNIQALKKPEAWKFLPWKSVTWVGVHILYSCHVVFNRAGTDFSIEYFKPQRSLKPAIFDPKACVTWVGFLTLFQTVHSCHVVFNRAGTGFTIEYSSPKEAWNLEVLALRKCQKIKKFSKNVWTWSPETCYNISWSSNL